MLEVGLDSGLSLGIGIFEEVSVTRASSTIVSVAEGSFSAIATELDSPWPPSSPRATFKGMKLHLSDLNLQEDCGHTP